MASIARNASGTMCESDAEVPAASAASTNVTAWPTTTTVEAATMTATARGTRRMPRISVLITRGARRITSMVTTTAPSATATSGM